MLARELRELRALAEAFCVYFQTVLLIFDNRNFTHNLKILLLHFRTNGFPPPPYIKSK